MAEQSLVVGLVLKADLLKSTIYNHHKNRIMKKPDELRHVSDPGEVKEETKQEPAADVAQAPETGEAVAE